jgi:hypothetical protein
MCKHCKYYHPYPPIEGEVIDNGTCRRHAPHPVYPQGLRDDGTTVGDDPGELCWVWPTVWEEEPMCGEGTEASRHDNG